LCFLDLHFGALLHHNAFIALLWRSLLMSQKLLLLAVCCGACLLLLTAAAGCRQKRDAQVDEALGELDAFTRELLQKIESNTDPSAGVGEAQKYFDERKHEIASKLAALKEVRGNQVSNIEETEKKMRESLMINIFSMDGLRTKYLTKSMGDPAFKAKLDKLVNDYQALLKS
jgi:hypothetical protein